MLASARPNDACSAGSLYAPGAPASGWEHGHEVDGDAEVGRLHRGVGPVVPLHLVAPSQLPARAFAQPPDEHRPELKQLRAVWVGVLRRHPCAAPFACTQARPRRAAAGGLWRT